MKINLKLSRTQTNPKEVGTSRVRFKFNLNLPDEICQNKKFCQNQTKQKLIKILRNKFSIVPLIESHLCVR